MGYTIIRKKKPFKVGDILVKDIEKGIYYSKESPSIFMSIDCLEAMKIKIVFIDTEERLNNTKL